MTIAFVCGSTSFEPPKKSSSQARAFSQFLFLGLHQIKQVQKSLARDCFVPDSCPSSLGY